jgi:hypothetical protein
VVLLQVHLQTQQKGNIGLIRMGVTVFKSDGVMGLYNGLTASLLRQVSVAMTCHCSSDVISLLVVSYNPFVCV